MTQMKLKDAKLFVCKYVLSHFQSPHSAPICLAFDQIHVFNNCPQTTIQSSFYVCGSHRCVGYVSDDADPDIYVLSPICHFA